MKFAHWEQWFFLRDLENALSWVKPLALSGLLMLLILPFLHVHSINSVSLISPVESIVDLFGEAQDPL